MNIDLLYKIIFIIAAYIFGSFPTAYVIHKIKRGDDIRKYGSGNVGGTNATRTLGVGYGIVTIITDIIKGFIPILVLYFIYPEDFVLLAVISVVVILGHDFPVFISFRGGKGIAVSFGVITGICSLPFMNNPIWIEIIPIFAILGTWALFFGIFRIVSIGSLCAAVVTPISFYFTGYNLPVVIAAFFWGVLVFITHRENIRRLATGKEKKLKR